MLKWIDRIPYLPLVIFALMLLLAPFRPAPHVWEKLVMLWNGTLNRPIDIFDLFYHLLPAAVLAVKLYRDRKERKKSIEGEDLS